MPEGYALDWTDLASLDQLIEAVEANPQYLKEQYTVAERQGTARVLVDRNEPFVVTDAMCCAYLIAHVTGTDMPGMHEHARRIDFTRSASVEDLVRVREKALGKLLAGSPSESEVEI